MEQQKRSNRAESIQALRESERPDKSEEEGTDDEADLLSGMKQGNLGLHKSEAPLKLRRLDTIGMNTSRVSKDVNRLTLAIRNKDRLFKNIFKTEDKDKFMNKGPTQI